MPILPCLLLDDLLFGQGRYGVRISGCCASRCTLSCDMVATTHKIYGFRSGLTSRLRHAGPKGVNREAELDRPSRVAWSDVLGGMVIMSKAQAGKK